MKKLFVVAVVLAVAGLCCGLCLAQDSQESDSSDQAVMSSDDEAITTVADTNADELKGETATGTVEEVNIEGKYVVIGGKHYAISDALMDSFDMEVGDDVEIIINDTDKGPEITDYSYM